MNALDVALRAAEKYDDGDRDTIGTYKEERMKRVLRALRREGFLLSESKIERCQAAVERKVKDFDGVVDQHLKPSDTVADQCRRAAKKGSYLCPQHQDTVNGMIGDPEQYLG